MANKFPKTFHTGAVTQYENAKYNLRTEANSDQYTSDALIDTYKFTENATEDSPEQSFVLFIIKNTGSDGSELDVTDIGIITSLSAGTTNPFSLVESYDGLGSTGQEGLNTTELLPSAITNAAGYVVTLLYLNLLAL